MLSTQYPVLAALTTHALPLGGRGPHAGAASRRRQGPDGKRLGHPFFRPLKRWAQLALEQPWRAPAETFHARAIRFLTNRFMGVSFADGLRYNRNAIGLGAQTERPGQASRGRQPPEFGR